MPDVIDNIINKVSGIFKGGSKRSSRQGSNIRLSKITRSEKFPNFMIIPLNENLFKERTPGDSEDVEQVASELGKTIKAALDRHYKNLNNFEVVEIYAMPTVAMKLTNFFNRPEYVSDFEKICGNQIWTSSQGQQDARNVVFFRRPLNYDAICETKIGSSLLVRPINSTGVVVPSSPDLLQGDSFQFLIGEIQVKDIRGNLIAQTPLRVWRPLEDELSYSLHLDFDVLSKAFGGAHHQIPLGIVLSCTTVIENGARQIENVGLNIEETKRWGTFLNNLVEHFLYTGYGRQAAQNNVNKLDADFITIEASAPQHYETIDAVTNVTRNLVFKSQTQNKDYQYVLRFFNRASRFDPKNNYFSLTGQIIRSGDWESVYSPPSFSFGAEEVFRILPDSNQQGKFKIWSKDKELTHQPTQGTENVFQPDQTFEASLGDEIIYNPRAVSKGDVNVFTFRLKDISDLPANIKQGKNFACLVEINPGKSTRVSQLLKDRHELGGGSFLANNTGISKKALVFERPYAQITIKPGDTEEVWIVDRAKNTHIDGKKVEKDGEALALNGRYEIYVDRFRFELNLSTTPLNY